MTDTKTQGPMQDQGGALLTNPNERWSNSLVQAATARALNTPFVPDPARPVLVTAMATIDASGGPPIAGLIELVDLTASGLVLAILYAGDAGVGGNLSAIVLPGHQVSLVTTIFSGVPVFVLQGTVETKL